MQIDVKSSQKKGGKRESATCLPTRIVIFGSTHLMRGFDVKNFESPICWLNKGVTSQREKLSCSNCIKKLAIGLTGVGQNNKPPNAAIAMRNIICGETSNKLKGWTPNGPQLKHLSGSRNAACCHNRRKILPEEALCCKQYH
jgi:hypothetical protein